MKELRLRYREPAEDSLEGWERYSLPLGNGYAGASVFGGVERERIQFTTNAFANTYKMGGVSSFADIFLESPEEGVSDYVRKLDLRRGIASSRFSSALGKTEREAFFNYPDNVFVYHVAFEKENNATIRLVIPYLTTRTLEEGGRIGKVYSENGRLVMRGELPSRNLLFEGRLSVLTDGKKTETKEGISVSNAKEITLLFAFDTSYRLCPEAFLTHKAVGEDPHAKVLSRIEKTENIGYVALLKRHLDDFEPKMERVSLDLGGVEDNRTTEELLESYRKGEEEPYLEELYYQYGRYLLLSSSRKGTTPASLQGTWSAHDKSPWGSGFWHNINIQMNYWPAFSTNLGECFAAYADFWKAYLPVAKQNAKEWIEETNPENLEGECGWTIGTASFCYEIEGKAPNSHSGPGTGGLTSKLFMDAYAFTGDESFLKEYAYPAIHGMASFLKKTLRKYDERLLCSFSASPEQILSGEWVKDHKMQQYIHTVGCSFDQQMVKEVFLDDLRISEKIEIFDDINKFEKENIASLDPIRVGYSGQIKEYDEEHFYGEIGEAKHRHLSELVALMPGEQITEKTPAYMDAARLTLDYRGDESTGWALAHRLCSRARTNEGNRAYKLLRTLLSKKTHPNLWDVHPPFQIDGNFGATAGITEMLLQSHGGFIHLLPALPKNWGTLSFKGLKARGNFEVSLSTKEGTIERCDILSLGGNEVILRYDGNVDGLVVTSHEKEEPVSKGEGTIRFATEKGRTYSITGFEKAKEPIFAKGFQAAYREDGVLLSWQKDERSYDVFRAEGNEAAYTLLGRSKEGTLLDKNYSSSHKGRLTYKLLPTGLSRYGEGRGSLAVLDPSSEIERERYAYRFETNNLNIGKK